MSNIASRAASLAALGVVMMKQKQLYIIRHGQALHNPRAEAARHAGCSYNEFLELMKQDDVLDAPLTQQGKKEALSITPISNVDLVVSSPLSRALETADLLFNNKQHPKRRICVEEFREINGLLLNAKRRRVGELQEQFPLWDFSQLTQQEDLLWTSELESQQACSERGYRGFCWLMHRPEESIVLVTHGGLLRFSMTQHSNIKLVDGRLLQQEQETEERRPVSKRFGNCEVRRYQMSWDDEQVESSSSNGDINAKPTIKLTEVDFNTEAEESEAEVESSI